MTDQNATSSANASFIVNGGGFGGSNDSDQHHDSRHQQDVTQHEGPKLGRRGDPRMHRAVAARLENPNLSLTEALQLGGFDVSCNEDEYGVTVGQRKNQLSRRLRLVRQSQTKNTQGFFDNAGSSEAVEATEHSSSIESPSFSDDHRHHDRHDHHDHHKETPRKRKQKSRKKDSRTANAKADGNSTRSPRATDDHMKSVSNRQETTASESTPAAAVTTVAPPTNVGTSNYSHSQLLQLHDAIRNTTANQPNNASTTTAFGTLNGTCSTNTASSTAAHLQNVLNMHRQEQQRKKTTMDLAALAGGMAGMNQHALQALLAGRLRSRNNSNNHNTTQTTIPASSTNNGYFHHTSSRPQDTNSNNPYTGGGGDGGFKTVEHEDIYKSFVRQQKWLNELLIKTCYQKGTAAAAAASGGGGGAFGGSSRSLGSTVSHPPPSQGAGSSAHGASLALGSRNNNMSNGRSCHACAPVMGGGKRIINNSHQHESSSSGKKRNKYDSSTNINGHSLSMTATQPTNTNDVRIDMVLTSHQTENASLLQRLMSQAGFTSDELMQHSPLYIEIASRAAQQELERVQRLKDMYLNNSSKSAASGGHYFNSNISNHTATTLSGTNKAYNWSSNKHHQHQETDSDNDTYSDISEEYYRKKYASSTKKQNPRSSSANHHHKPSSLAVQEEEDGKTARCNHSNNRRHVHRLMGKCGHRAIIHRPPNGEPHIDFIVNNRVECYQNVSPEVTAVGRDTLWPSRYGCDELNCNSSDNDDDDHDNNKNTNAHNDVKTPTTGKYAGAGAGAGDFVNSDNGNNHQKKDNKGRGPKCGSREESDRVKNALPFPQEFDISILKEWDVDIFEGVGDHSVLGLIELGKTSS